MSDTPRAPGIYHVRSSWNRPIVAEFDGRGWRGQSGDYITGLDIPGCTIGERVTPQEIGAMASAALEMMRTLRAVRISAPSGQEAAAVMLFTGTP